MSKNLDNIVEIQCTSESNEANKLLSEGWKLLDYSVERQRSYRGKVKMGTDFKPETLFRKITLFDRFEPIYEDVLTPIYFLAKYKE